MNRSQPDCEMLGVEEMLSAFMNQKKKFTKIQFNFVEIAGPKTQSHAVLICKN